MSPWCAAEPPIPGQARQAHAVRCRSGLMRTSQCPKSYAAAPRLLRLIAPVLGRARVAAVGWNSRAAEKFVQWPACCSRFCRVNWLLMRFPPKDVLGVFSPRKILGVFSPICKVGDFPPKTFRDLWSKTNRSDSCSAPSGRSIAASQCHFQPNRNWYSTRFPRDFGAQTSPMASDTAPAPEQLWPPFS
jgi:hypothetical protein